MINVTEGIVGHVQMCHLTNCHANVELKLPFHQYNVELSLRNAIELVLEITSVLILWGNYFLTLTIVLLTSFKIYIVVYH